MGFEREQIAPLSFVLNHFAFFLLQFLFLTLPQKQCLMASTVQIVSVLYQLMQFNIYFCLLDSNALTIVITEILYIFMPLVMYQMQGNTDLAATVKFPFNIP